MEHVKGVIEPLNLDSGETWPTSALATFFRRSYFTTFRPGWSCTDRSPLSCMRNEAAERFLGLTMDQLLGKSAMDPAWSFIREDGSVMPVEEYPVHRVLATRQSFRGQVVGVNRPSRGDQVWGLTNAFPEFAPDGALQRIVVTFVDITERRQAEERQRHLTEVLRAIRNVNQLITQEKDQGVLLQRACDLLTQSRGYHSAWIALRGPDGRLAIGGHSGLAAGLEPMRERLLPAACRSAVRTPRSIQAWCTNPKPRAVARTARWREPMTEHRSWRASCGMTSRIMEC
jgi:PAS domain S-box-containing protein